ncbi:hypothetical protein J2W34_000071 [Variovorax boronicumulans]|uniref:hypothetical protein n=1 Tax=Variovorax boronicumulans TaxID=436515 RepID=UPI002786573B|nr:hypothetical protein [Variovorax boronicumulans]MDQ0068297.1 hypothetical protein [Variovorax boronicumulans]
MRDYAKAEPKMWHGETMKALRKTREGLIVGLYLMTSPSSNMLGLFGQPILYMAYETGLGEEGARKGLQSCIEAGYCSYDDATEVVWVYEMAKYQIANELKASDKQCVGIQKAYDALPKNPFLGEFFDRYESAFHLTRRRSADGATQAPSKPLRSQEQEQEQEQEQKTTSLSAEPTAPKCQAEEVVALYHEMLPEMPKVRLMTDKRKKAIANFWRFVLTSKKTDGTRRAQTADQALTWIRDYFSRARDNDFLMGRTQRAGEHASWQCDLDFLLTDKGKTHVIEKTREAA